MFIGELSKAGYIDIAQGVSDVANVVLSSHRDHMIGRWQEKETTKEYSTNHETLHYVHITNMH